MAVAENVAANRKIWLAGGCFWGVEAYFAHLDGVISTRVGYANGDTTRARYENLSKSGHAETVEVTYDASSIALGVLLEHFFAIIDPFSVNRQGPDIGRQYRSAIFYVDKEDGETARAFLALKGRKQERPLAVIAEPLAHFARAEEEHQQYLAKHPAGYCHLDLESLWAQNGAAFGQ